MSCAGSGIASEKWPGPDNGCMPAFLETERLVLRGFTEDDVPVPDPPTATAADAGRSRPARPAPSWRTRGMPCAREKI
jgi:hypothetical protein